MYSFGKTSSPNTKLIQSYAFKNTEQLKYMTATVCRVYKYQENGDLVCKNHTGLAVYTEKKKK